MNSHRGPFFAVVILFTLWVIALSVMAATSARAPAVKIAAPAIVR